MCTVARRLRRRGLAHKGNRLPIKAQPIGINRPYHHQTSGVLILGSVFGFPAVLGIAVRHSLTLVSRYRYLEEHEGETLGADLVERGTRERSAPILMTAVATALALLPLAFFGNIDGLEILRPIAIVVLGDVVTATLFALASVPAIYLLFGEAREPELEGLQDTAVTEEGMGEGLART